MEVLRGSLEPWERTNKHFQAFHILLGLKISTHTAVKDPYIIISYQNVTKKSNKVQVTHLYTRVWMYEPTEASFSLNATPKSINLTLKGSSLWFTNIILSRLRSEWMIFRDFKCLSALATWKVIKVRHLETQRNIWLVCWNCWLTHKDLKQFVGLPDSPVSFLFSLT